jgi:NADH dehydrogenase/NADH:ubiquinone oxidoreductase subunit G
MEERDHHNEKREHPETRILRLEYHLEKQQLSFQYEKEFAKKEADYEKKLDTKDREIEKLKDEVIDLEEELEELENSMEKQSGELSGVASMFKGIDLAELGAGIIRKMANPKLLTTLGMTSGDEEQKEIKKPEDESSFVPSGHEKTEEHSEQLEAVNQIAGFLKEMPAPEFKKVYLILSRMEAKRPLIDKVFNLLEKEKTSI